LAQLALFPSAVCVPLRGPDGPLGALGLFALAAQHYTTGDLSLMSLLAGTAENIARRLLLVDEAARADQGRLRSDRLRDELFEQIASEVLSPLTVLDRGLELLQSSVSSPEANQTREQVDELRLVAGTLTETVGNLVELQQIDDATRPVRPAIVSLDSFLRERIQARALAARLGEARMMIRCDPPTAQITTDTRLLARVVDTLLLNALRHTPRRGEVALVAVSRPRKLIVAVADTGVSIPASERESILSRGPRGDRPPSRAFGLGFARAAIEYLGGTLTVEAPPGCGSLFRMTLPLLA
jgi:NtrC-family two-component system sensor histidine kinase KinB